MFFLVGDKNSRTCETNWLGTHIFVWKWSSVGNTIVLIFELEIQLHIIKVLKNHVHIFSIVFWFSYDREAFVNTFMLQIGILSNHLNGRDTHVRQIKVYGPRPYVTIFLDKVPIIWYHIRWLEHWCSSHRCSCSGHLSDRWPEHLRSHLIFRCSLSRAFEISDD